MKPDPLRTAWHTLDAQEVLSALTVDPARGLTSSEVTQRQVQYGANELVQRAAKGALGLLWEQTTQPMVVILLVAALVSGLLGEIKSVVAIMAIVVLNAVLGVVQEYRAEKAMSALRKMAAPAVRVRRDGRVLDVPARDLVPGDVVLLEAGNIVAADGRLVEAANVRVQEASLTGESLPVDKSALVLSEEAIPVGDRRNMVYMGTAVTFGRGTAVVVETGMRTELGRIADLIQTVSSGRTPLQQRLGQLGKVLLIAAALIIAVSFMLGMLRGEDPSEMFLIAVAMAVAVVPEGLPAVVTVSLALGAQRMLRRRALIRKLPAVETLGSVTVIASDKTGTLTENRMTVKIIDVAGHTAEMTEAMRGGHPVLEPDCPDCPHTASQTLLMLSGALCNDAVLERDDTHRDDFVTIGDPTEGALVIAAARFDLWKPELEQAFPRVGEAPFSSERRRMTTVHHVADGHTVLEQHRLGALFNGHRTDYIAFSKGAVDSMLAVSTGVWVDNAAQPLTADWRGRIEEASNSLAQEGLRVLGIGFRPVEALADDAEILERDFVFVGMVGMIDPPRPEVKLAVETCKAAGIRPVMITGDHPLTARQIAQQLGIAANGRVLTGVDLAGMSEAEIDALVEEVSVYARVAPEQKLTIVQALRRRGHIVAMTGDGVNDAPALRQADIGVAMGITGTAVSKEASDMVILDDNFATIVSAVQEGRTIYDNVRRFIKYLLASNTGELFVLQVTQMISGMMIPLTTLQILWMNLITDGVPALALGVERAEKGSMSRPPHAPNESLLGRGLGRHILLIGTLMGVCGVSLGWWAWSNDLKATNGTPAWNTMVFIFLTIAQMGHALGLRSHRESLFTLDFFGNRLLIGAVLFTFGVQMLAIYTPFFNDLFSTAPLTFGQLALCFALSTVVFGGVELEKFAVRKEWLK
jgi:Ca2+-transporting ATPase